MNLINYDSWDYSLKLGDKFCMICEGELYGSDCCGADFAEPGYPDNDICSECKEHSEPAICENCEGKHQQVLSAEEIVELKNDIKLNKADDLSDESRGR